MYKRLLFVSFFFLSLNFLTPMITLFYLDRGAGQEHIFLILLAFSMSVFLFEIPTGIFGDKYGLKLSLVLGAFCRLVGAVMLFTADSVVIICLSRILDGLGYALFSGALETYCYESLKQTNQESELGGFFGKIESISYFSSILAYLVGAFVVTSFTSQQFDTIALLWVIATILQFLPILFLPKVQSPDTDNKSKSESHLKVAFNNVVTSKPLMFLFVNYTLIFIPIIIFDKFYQVALFNLEQPSYMFGIIAVSTSLIALMLSYKVDWLVNKFSNVYLFNVTGILVIIGFGLIYLFPTNKYVVYGSIFLISTPLAIRWPVYVQLRNNLIPDKSRTTTISLLSIVDSIFDLLILGMLGLWTSIALENVLLACLIICLAGMLFFVRKNSLE